MTPVTPGPSVPTTDRSWDRLVARAASITAALTVAGALCGLARDQILAHYFGADGETDAFLVAWTIPEIAATLLIEEAMALVLVPAFSLALVCGAGPLRDLVAATLPRLLLGLAVAAAVVAAAAGPLVRALAPGLADPALAVDCTRLTAATVLFFGVAGYLSALLRAHRCFAPPAAIYIAYNLSIVAAALALHHAWGVRAAAAGVAAGGLLMVAMLAPAALRRLRCAARDSREGPPRGPRGRRSPRPAVPAALAAVVAPVALFALARQSQVLVERFLASSLPSGAISHLNYAQKVAQLPMSLAMMLCTVTLPLVARAMAEGDTERARRCVERDLQVAGAVVLLGAAFVTACAPQLIQVLFQRGEFGADATAATAGVMRVYALGVLGHLLVGALVRPFCSAARPGWFPVAAMAAGLLVTVVAGFAAVRLCGWGAPGIAAANAAGITLTAFLLLRGLAARIIPVDVPGILARLGRMVLAAAAATAAGWGTLAALPGLGLAVPPLAACALGGLVVAAVFTPTAVPRTVVTSAVTSVVRSAVRSARGRRRQRSHTGRTTHTRADQAEQAKEAKQRCPA